MWLGAGVLVALAASAAVAGWWLLGGVVLAGVLAACAARPATAAPGAQWLLDGARTAARLAGVPLCAAAFAVYLVPQYSALTALGVVVLVTTLDAVGFTLPRLARGWLLGTLLVAAAGLIAVCLAIPPVPQPTTTNPPFTSAFAAGAVFFPLFARDRADRTNKKIWWLAGSVAVALAVGAAALYQLGPVRLGLSRVPVRDLLAAVDGQVIEPLLAAAVVVATLPAALGALASARAEFSWRPVASLCCGAVAGVGAALLSPVQALLLAATLALAEVVVAGVLTLAARRRDVPTVLGVVLAIVLLAWIPPGYLLLAVLLVVIAGLVRRASRPQVA